jgi:hypothetical protein
MGSPAALGTQIVVVANPYSVSAPAPLESSVDYTPLPTGVTLRSGIVNPSVLVVSLAPGHADLTSVPVTYGQFFDSKYHEAVSVQYIGQATIASPGATQSAPFYVNAVRRLPMPATGPLSVDPIISPPKDPKVGGVSLFLPLSGVTTTPTFTWSAPSTGTSSSYTLQLFKLGVDAAKATIINPVPVLWAKVTTPSFQVPEGIITAGSSYFVTITAAQAPYDQPEFGSDYAYPWASATCISKPFTP